MTGAHHIHRGPLRGQALQQPNDVVMKSTARSGSAIQPMESIRTMKAKKRKARSARPMSIRIDGQSGVIRVACAIPSSEPDDFLTRRKTLYRRYRPLTWQEPARRISGSLTSMMTARWAARFRGLHGGPFRYGFRIDEEAGWRTAAQRRYCFDYDSTLIGKLLVPEVVFQHLLWRPRSAISFHLRHDITAWNPRSVIVL